MENSISLPNLHQTRCKFIDVEYIILGADSHWEEKSIAPPIDSADKYYNFLDANLDYD